MAKGNMKMGLGSSGKKRSGKRDQGGGRQAAKLGKKRSPMGPYS